MTTRELTVRLPEPLAGEAEEKGLLRSEEIERLLREELRRRRVDELFDAAERLADLPLPPLTQAEVEAEIKAARNERRSANARGC